MSALGGNGNANGIDTAPGTPFEILDALSVHQLEVERINNTLQ